MQKIARLKIDGMHCPSCEKLIAMALEDLPEVISSDISTSKGEATISFDSSLKTEAILSTIKKAGYDAELIKEKNETV